MPPRFEETEIKILDTLVLTLVQPMIDYVRDDATETAPTEDQNLLVSCLRILRVCLKIFENESTWE